MKTKEIQKIAPIHRVTNIGKYNAGVTTCPHCISRVFINLNDIIGFGTDSEGFIVEVSECPECYKKSYHHFFGFDYYDMFVMNKEANE